MPRSAAHRTQCLAVATRNRRRPTGLGRRAMRRAGTGSRERTHVGGQTRRALRNRPSARPPLARPRPRRCRLRAAPPGRDAWPALVEVPHAATNPAHSKAAAEPGARTRRQPTAGSGDRWVSPHSESAGSAAWAPPTAPPCPRAPGKPHRAQHLRNPSGRGTGRTRPPPPQTRHRPPQRAPARLCSHASQPPLAPAPPALPSHRLLPRHRPAPHPSGTPTSPPAPAQPTPPTPPPHASPPPARPPPARAPRCAPARPDAVRLRAPGVGSTP